MHSMSPLWALLTEAVSCSQGLRTQDPGQGLEIARDQGLSFRSVLSHLEQVAPV